MEAFEAGFHISPGRHYLMHFNGLILDITEQKQAVQQVYQALESRIDARTRELQAILTVIATASSSLDLDEMLSAALDRLVILVSASRAGGMLVAYEPGAGRRGGVRRGAGADSQGIEQPVDRRAVGGQLHIAIDGAVRAYHS